MRKAPQAVDVSVHPEVVDMTLHFSHERGVLLLDWKVPVLSTPRIHSLYGPCQSRTPGLARHCPTFRTSSPPVPAEPEDMFYKTCFGFYPCMG
jgi:hypothetical protein